MLPKYALIDAITNDDVACVQSALDAGANINDVDWQGKTMLEVAERSGANMVIRTLVRSGANVNAHVNDRHDTLLHIATRKGNIGFVAALLDEGANPNPVNCRGETPLHIAAKRGLSFLARRLVEGNADLSMRDSQGKSAGQLATENSRYETARLLERKELAQSNLDAIASQLRPSHSTSVYSQHVLER